MQQLRAGEEDPGKVFYRSDRYFIADDKWYFSTREGKDIGPFKTRQAAVNGLHLFVQNMQHPSTANVGQAARVAMQGLWASTNYR